ncbi:hypothetical protein VUR80DRAFT_1292 [Thermomyces stellatus]
MRPVYPSRAEGEKSRMRDKKLRRQYILCVTGGEGNLMLGFHGWVAEVTDLSVLQNCGMEGFKGMTEVEYRGISYQSILEMLARNARAIESERAGYKRHLRRCNECRYQLGRLPMHSRPNHGSDVMPIVTGRQIRYGLLLDRWFPGFLDRLKNDRPDLTPFLARIRGRESRSQPFTTFMARCRRCARWQELRNFRIGGTFPHWKPLAAAAEPRAADVIEGHMVWDGRETPQELLHGADCNVCFAETHGREELGAALVRWFGTLLDHKLANISSALLLCFKPWKTMVTHLPNRYRTEVRALLRNTPCFNHSPDYCLTYSDMAILRLRRSQWKEMAGRLTAEDPKRMVGALPVEWWADELADVEVQLNWMTAFLDDGRYDADRTI